MNGMIERVQKYTLPALMVLIPFMVLTKGLIHSSHHLAIVLFAAILIGAMTRNVWVFAFMLYFSAWEVALFWGAMGRTGSVPAAVAGLDMMVYLIAGAVFFVAARTSTLKISTFYNFICVAAITQSVIAALQFFGFDLFLIALNMFIPARGQIGEGTMLGTLGNPNFLAAYLAISLPFFFRRGWCWFIPLIAAILFRSWTSSAVVPAIIGTVVFFWDREAVKEYWTIIVPSVLGVIATYLFMLDAPFWESPRWGFWMQAVCQLDTIPKALLGLGPGARWAGAFPLHSEWITALHQFGVIGFGLAAGYAVALCRGNRFFFAALLIALINAGGNYNLHLAPSAAMIAVIAGLIERERENHGNQTDM